jgi:fructose-1,6-bisphosphatase/inositol monophosphatase family enzyme
MEREKRNRLQNESDRATFASTIIDSIVRVFAATQRDILECAWSDPTRCFESVYLDAQGKLVKACDLVAEWKAVEMLRSRMNIRDALIVGEESLARMCGALGTQTDLTILLDVIDGTRLLEHGSDGWCSAAVAFLPPTGEIIASVVMLPSGVAYCASAAGAWKCRLRHGAIQVMPLSGPSARRSCGEVSIAFYGYTKKRFLSLSTGQLGRLLESGDLSKNVFIVGGNPALVRTMDGTQQIDVVVEPFGQAPHDVIAGAYFCRQAGGAVIDLNGGALDLEGILQGPLTRKLRFVAASDSELANSICRQLRTPAGSAAAA